MGHCRREQLDRAIDTRLSRNAFHDAHGGRAAFIRRRSRVVVGKRAAGARPHPSERRFERGDGRPTHDHHRITPTGPSLPGITRPFVADAEAAGHRAFAVDDEQLAVIAAERFDWPARPDRSERANVHAVTPQLAPEPAAGAAAAEGIIQDSDAHAGAGPLGPRRGEAAAGVIVVDDVILEMDGALCAREVTPRVRCVP